MKLRRWQPMVSLMFTGQGAGWGYCKASEKCVYHELRSRRRCRGLIVPERGIFDLEDSYVPEPRMPSPVTRSATTPSSGDGCGKYSVNPLKKHNTRQLPSRQKEQRWETTHCTTPLELNDLGNIFIMSGEAGEKVRKPSCETRNCIIFLIHQR